MHDSVSHNLSNFSTYRPEHKNLQFNTREDIPVVGVAATLSTQGVATRTGQLTYRRSHRVLLFTPMSTRVEDTLPCHDLHDHAARCHECMTPNSLA